MFSASSSIISGLIPLRHGVCLLLLAQAVTVLAQEPAVFTPPKAYPVERYEAGWNKNPFTLKTVEPAVAQVSFARDLAIGAHYGAADNPTIVIVNTKTNVRTLLRKDKPAPDGMRLKTAHLSSSRQECQVEIVLGAEAAVLKYDTQYLQQFAAAEASRMAATKASAAPAAKGSRVPPLPVPPAKNSAPSPAKVSHLEPPVPMPATAPVPVLPPLPLPISAP